MALSHSPRIVTDGLVCYLDASNTKSYPGTGTTWFDLSGNGYNGTLQGTTTFDATAKAIDLGTTPNTTNYISIPEASLSGLSTWTLEFILSMDAINTNTNAFFTGGGSNDLLFLYSGTQLLQVYNTDLVSLGDAKIQEAFTGNVFQTTLTGTGGASGTIKLYLNNDYVGQLTQNTLITPNTNLGLVLGQEMDNADGLFASNQCWLGRYYTVKFYNRVLTDTELTQNYICSRGRYGL